MEQQNIQSLYAPNGFYHLGKLSKVDVVVTLVSKYGKPSRSISVNDAEQLIADNTIAATPLQKERTTFTEAGISFNFIGDELDVKSLRDEAVAELELIKERKSEGYVFLKRGVGLPIVQEADVGRE